MWHRSGVHTRGIIRGFTTFHKGSRHAKALSCVAVAVGCVGRGRGPGSSPRVLSVEWHVRPAALPELPELDGVGQLEHGGERESLHGRLGLQVAVLQRIAVLHALCALPAVHAVQLVLRALRGAVLLAVGLVRLRKGSGVAGSREGRNVRFGPVWSGLVRFDV